MPRENHGTETITIAGQPFEAPLRYAEGHELTAGEASQLNQVLHENLRNNFAKKVKEAVEANAFDAAAFQQSFNEYADTYEMGERVGGGGGSRDPIMTAAMNIAREIIRTALKKKGKKISEVDPKAINEAARTLISKGDARSEEIMAQARQRVEDAKSAADADLLDLVADMPDKPAKEDPAQAAA